MKIHILAWLGLCAAIGLSTPALADDGWHRHDRQEWREHQWREHEWREHEWHEHHSWEHSYPPPAYGYYTPPPVYYGGPGYYR